MSATDERERALAYRRDQIARAAGNRAALEAVMVPEPEATQGVDALQEATRPLKRKGGGLWR